MRIVAAALLSLVLLTGCAAGTASFGDDSVTDAAAKCGPSTVRTAGDVDPVKPAPEPDLPATVESADGREVTVRSADRVLAVNMYGSLAEIVFSLGLGDRVVGRDASTTFPSARDLPLVTNNGHDLSAEAILRLNPTVVLADAGIGPPEALDQLRASGIPVVMIGDEQTLPAIGEHVTAVAEALGVPDAGKALRTRIDRQVEAARTDATASSRPLRVAFLYLRGTAGVYLIGGDGAGSDALIEAVGASTPGPPPGSRASGPSPARG
ncbi:hemin ABC transporter substrate-binding protein [Actinomadura sp. CNU-125]|uniref:heme/hemin ABC transporter substrate-binding protein n=1 Tax=Actinomadura sp. CNU-125 TaxID=1904961 RepID=UPI000AE23625|nr:ABC transporter substrate-binding protein [Actinomadura sp. CNU-125]